MNAQERALEMAFEEILDLREKLEAAEQALATLREALEELFDSYKGLADSGDAGDWRLEDQPEGKRAMAALASLPKPATEPPSSPQEQTP